MVRNRRFIKKCDNSFVSDRTQNVNYERKKKVTFGPTTFFDNNSKYDYFHNLRNNQSKEDTSIPNTNRSGQRQNATDNLQTSRLTTTIENKQKIIDKWNETKQITRSGRIVKPPSKLST